MQHSHAVDGTRGCHRAGRLAWCACCTRRVIGSPLRTGGRSVCSRLSTSSTLASWHGVSHGGWTPTSVTLTHRRASERRTAVGNIISSQQHSSTKLVANIASCVPCDTTSPTPSAACHMTCSRKHCSDRVSRPSSLLAAVVSMLMHRSPLATPRTGLLRRSRCRWGCSRAFLLALTCLPLLSLRCSTLSSVCGPSRCCRLR